MAQLPNISAGQIITASHINLIKNGLYAWSADVDANDYALTELDRIQINAGTLPVSPTVGTIAIDSADSNKLKFWDGSAWQTSGGLSGTVAIANGGTGQTTAGAALAALLPTQSGNSGKVLKTDGTTATWQDDAGITGTVAISSGGTGQTSAGAALTALLPSQSGNNGKVLKSNGTSASWQDDLGLTGTVAISSGGTGQTTATAALNALLPSQSGNSGKVLKSDGTNATWQDDDNSGGGGGGGGVAGPYGSASLNFGSIDDGATAELTFTLAGAAVGDRVAPSWPSALDAGLVGMMFVSATNTITVRLLNLSGVAINPASMTFGAQAIQNSYLVGSASLNFSAIDDGATAELTFSITGAVVGDSVAPAWPAALDAGLLGMMRVSAADTITVRLLNLSGSQINPASMTFGAQVFQ